MEHFSSCVPIPVESGTSINHVAFDGCDYFCTIRCKCEIIRFDPCSQRVHRYCTSREYDCICYDYCDHCFWTSSRTNGNKLFKLDCSMNEIDCIPICTPGQNDVITGVSYNCCKDALLVSYLCSVVEVDKQSEKSSVLYTTRKYWIVDVLSICPGILLTVLKNGHYYIQVLNRWGEKIGCYCLDSPDKPQNLIFNPCESNCPREEIRAFVLKKNCYPYLCKCSLSLGSLCFKPCRCNYRICEECCCEEKSCHTPCEDVMESIALVETALSHILNAEGEKIQKVLSSTDDIDKILCVNREVNKTIVNATHLEHTLYAKLSALSDCGLCDDCKAPPDDCKA